MDLIFSSLFGTRNGWMANQMVGKLHMEPKHYQFQQQHQHLYNVLHVSNGRFCSANFCPHPLNMLRASEQRWNHLDFFKHGLYQRIPGDDQPLCFPVYLVLYPIVSKQEFVQLNMKPEVHQFHQWSLKKKVKPCETTLSLQAPRPPIVVWGHPARCDLGDPGTCTSSDFATCFYLSKLRIAWFYLSKFDHICPSRNSTCQRALTVIYAYKLHSKMYQHPPALDGCIPAVASHSYITKEYPNLGGENISNCEGFLDKNRYEIDCI